MDATLYLRIQSSGTLLRKTQNSPTFCCVSAGPQNILKLTLYIPMMMMMMKKITAEPDVLAINKIADHNKSVGHFLPKSSVVVWLSREKYCSGHLMHCSVVKFFMFPGKTSGLKSTKHLATLVSSVLSLVIRQRMPHLRRLR
jgi:hypothetical protein